MKRRLKQAAVVFVVFAAAQLVRPERANPRTDPSRTIQAHMGTSSGLVAVLDRACSDCHSNATVWPWYTQVAPVSWLMAQAVTEGRKAVNFSEWAAYSPDQQRPGPTVLASWTWLVLSLAEDTQPSPAIATQLRTTLAGC